MMHQVGSLPAEGEWIELSYRHWPLKAFLCLSLQRESGLKCQPWCMPAHLPESLPAEGEWIEIMPAPGERWNSWSLLAEGEWIEISWKMKWQTRKQSVSPRRGRVDWNGIGERLITVGNPVSPCRGRVDWNNTNYEGNPKAGKSLPAEGEWIEISSHKQYTSCHGGLSQQRESGLKYNLYLLLRHCQASHPVKGERIK